MEPSTCSRAVSEKRHVGLLRVGHPFVNAMETLVRNDDRGAAFAMAVAHVRFRRHGVFAVHFVIEADDSFHTM